MSRRALPLLACIAASACALVTLREEERDFYSSTVLVGRVIAAQAAGPIVVAARDARGQVVHHALIGEPGGYELIVPAGEYSVVAFADANRNFTFDAGEAAGRFDGPEAVRASGTGMVLGLDVALSTAASPPLAAGSRFPQRPDSGAGAPASLDDASLSAAQGTRGYWEPMASFRERGASVYFLEPYDPARIPVLFIHGAGGSGSDWRDFAGRLDRKRYQAWIFQYPSGASVESMSHLLYWKLFNLQLRHRFERLHLVAHSMGGLVARKFLVDHGSQFPQVRTFISLSTPWGGEPLADLGVRRSPAVIPSWRDMRPDGAFMRSLFEGSLPAGVEHHLFFGYKGGGIGLARPSNDGTVTLASQLRPDAQGQARVVMGFDEDHGGILHSERAIAQCAAIIARSDGAGIRGHGAVRVVHAIEGEPTQPVLPTLMLVEQGSRERLYFAVAGGEDGGEVSPVAPGRYEATLFAEGMRSDPTRVQVAVGAGEVPTVRYRLRPDGMLSGFVVARADAVANPAGSFRKPGQVRVQSITLTGVGTRIVLEPRGDGLAECLDRVAEGMHCAAQGQFWFTGLPAGDYRLEVRAEGFAQYEARHAVVPGRRGPAAPIELVPLAAR